MIGVIAALTLPTLMNSTNEKEIVARVKKVNANLNEAMGRAVAKYGPADTWIRTGDTNATGKPTRLGKRLFEFMQVEKDCETSKVLGCFSSKDVTAIDGTGKNSSIDVQLGCYKVILSDGTSVAINNNGIIFIDIDGSKKGGNVYGKDIFYTMMDAYRISTSIHESATGYSSEDTYDDEGNITSGGTGVADHGSAGVACRKLTNSFACMDWIIHYDNADYINCEVTDANPTCN